MTTHNKCDDTECNGEYCYGFNCWDCNVNTLHTDEYYMVNDGVWEVATEDFGGDGMLCIGCLEARLGDRLTADDFTDAPINHGIYPQSARLQQRMATSK
jgi:hypothetical protein